MARIQHQLSIHLDFVPGDDGLAIIYSYPFSGNHEVREHCLRLSRSNLDQQFCADLDLISHEMINRIGALPTTRLPHTKEITPQVKPAVLTVVVQDQQRRNDVPLARMYYNEVIREIQSQKEREVHANRSDFSSTELEALARIKSRAKAIAWSDYSTKVAPYLRT